MRSWKSPHFHPVQIASKQTEDEPYDGPCPCCDSSGNNFIIDRTSKAGITVICRDCGAMWKIAETNSRRR